MTVLLVLGVFGIFLIIDWFHTRKTVGTVRYNVPGYEALGAVACDGGKKISESD